MRKLKKNGAWILAAVGLGGSAVQQLYSLTAQADEVAQTAQFVSPAQTLSPEKQAALKAVLEGLRTQFGQEAVESAVLEWKKGKLPLVGEHALDHQEWFEEHPSSN